MVFPLFIFFLPMVLGLIIYLNSESGNRNNTKKGNENRFKNEPGTVSQSRFLGVPEHLEEDELEEGSSIITYEDVSGYTIKKKTYESGKTNIQYIKKPTEK